MNPSAAWRRRQLVDACDLQRTHLDKLIGIHRRQVDQTVHRATRLAELALQGLRLYRSWRRPGPGPAPEASASPDKIRLAIDVALSLIDCWRAPGKD